MVWKVRKTPPDLIWRRPALLRPSWTRCSLREGSQPGAAGSPRCSPLWTAWFALHSGTATTNTQTTRNWWNPPIRAWCSRCRQAGSLWRVCVEVFSGWFCFGVWKLLLVTICLQQLISPFGLFWRFWTDLKLCVCWFGSSCFTFQSHQDQMFREFLISFMVMNKRVIHIEIYVKCL